MAREYFCAYHDYRDAIDLLSDAEAGRLFKSLLKFSATGEVEELRGSEQYLFAMMKNQIVRDMQRYEEICETNRRNRSKRTSTTVNERKRTSTVGYKEKEKEEEKGEEEREKKEKEKDNTNTDVIAPAARERVNYSAVVDLFNSTCTSLPEVQQLSDKRRKAISARMKEIKFNYDELKKVFETVEASDFLTGRAGEWQASFDWIFKPSNWQKIREGNYANRKAQPKDTGRYAPTFDIDEVEQILDEEWNSDNGESQSTSNLADYGFDDDFLQNFTENSDADNHGTS